MQSPRMHEMPLFLSPSLLCTICPSMTTCGLKNAPVTGKPPAHLSDRSSCTSALVCPASLWTSKKCLFIEPSGLKSSVQPPTLCCCHLLCILVTSQYGTERPRDLSLFFFFPSNSCITLHSIFNCPELQFLFK